MEKLSQNNNKNLDAINFIEKTFIPQNFSIYKKSLSFHIIFAKLINKEQQI